MFKIVIEDFFQKLLETRSLVVCSNSVYFGLSVLFCSRFRFHAFLSLFVRLSREVLVRKVFTGSLDLKEKLKNSKRDL